MRTDYFAHDRQYQLRKAAGSPGWGSAADIAENTGHLAAALAAGRIPPSGRVLELGCGAGDISLWLAERGFEVWGVDLSPTAIAWARDKAGERSLTADFQVGDVLTLAGHADAYFDLVVDGCCLHCIVGEDRARVLRSAARVLKPGGVLYVITMCGDPVHMHPNQRFDPTSRCLLHGDTAIRYYGLPAAILAEIADAGFNIAHQEVKPPATPADQYLLLVTAENVP